jgi:hypothetical protein
MKVFISWSGKRSGAVAEALHRWLKNVIQRLDPWMSKANIPMGKQWVLHLFTELKNTNFGIICVTPENLEAPYLLFEAGALAKQVEEASVVPYLFQLKPTDLKGPLTAFQGANTDEEDTRKVLEAINAALGKDGLSYEQLKEAFKKWWPDLKAALDQIPPETTEPKRPRDMREIAEETLQLVRNIAGSPIVSGPVPLPVVTRSDVGPPREGFRLGDLGKPKAFLDLYGLSPETQRRILGDLAVAPPSTQQGEPGEERPPERSPEEASSSGTAEAGRETERVRPRPHVPRKRR